jgi:O-antigen/teichoic acid export membrane protein
MTPDAAAATTGASLLRGSRWTLAGAVLPQLNTVVLSVAIARFLGPDDFGRQSFIAFVAISITTLGSAGLGNALARFISESHGRGDYSAIRKLVRWGFRVMLGLAVLGAAGPVAAGLLGADPAGAWILAGAVVALGLLHGVPNSFLVGMQRWREASMVGLVTGVVTVPTMIAVLAYDGGITGIFAVELAMVSVNLLWTSWLARRTLEASPPGPEPRPELPGGVARFAAVLTFTVLLQLVVFRRSEFAFLDAFSSDAQIGFYSISFAAVTALGRVPYAIGLMLMPAFATLLGAGVSDRIRSGFTRLLRLLPLITLPLTAVSLALGGPALELLYGDDYQDAVPVLMLMLAGFPIVPVTELGGALLVALARLRPFVIALGSATVLNVALSVVLVPPYGAIGAAIANISAQVAAGVPLLVYAIRVIGVGHWSPDLLLRAFVASASAGLAGFGAVSLVEGPAGLVAGLLAALSALAATSLALRVLAPEDAAWIEGLGGDRLPPVLGRWARLAASQR